jgi:hypothetical protein
MHVHMDHALHHHHSVVVLGTMLDVQADASGPHEIHQNEEEDDDEDVDDEDDEDDGVDTRTGIVDDTNNLTVVGAWATAGCKVDEETIT